MTSKEALEHYATAVIMAVCKDCGIAETDRDELVTRLWDDGFSNMRFLVSYGGGALKKEPPEPATLQALQAQLTGPRTGPPASVLARSVALDTAIAEIVEKSWEWVKENDPTRLAKEASREDAGSLRALIDQAYKMLLKLHGLNLTIDQRATFVGSMTHEVNTTGYISTAPSLSGMTLQGTTKEARSKLRFADSDVTIPVEKERTESVGDIARCQDLTRFYWYGILAVLGRPITDKAYGGKDVGWISVPGEVKQRRVGMSRDKCEELIFHIIRHGGTNVGPYVGMQDGVVREFIREFALKQRHPDTIISDFILDRAALFRIGGSSSTASSVVPSESDAGEAIDAAEVSGGGDYSKGVCVSWLTTGGCNDDLCPFTHAAGHRGGLVGNRGRSTGGGNGGGNGGGSSGSRAPEWMGELVAAITKGGRNNNGNNNRGNNNNRNGGGGGGNGNNRGNNNNNRNGGGNGGNNRNGNNRNNGGGGNNNRNGNNRGGNGGNGGGRNRNRNRNGW